MSSRPNSDQIDRLTPLLASLARLIAQGSPITEKQLNRLLASADIQEDKVAFAELKRWTDELSSLHADPSPGERAAVVEYLYQRGLPEAPVLLAVDTVTRQSSEGGASTGSAATLTVQPERLDFSLGSGQGATRELHVQGGTGRIEINSDQLRIEPQQFGPEPTIVEVEVLPLDAGMVYATISFLAAAQTVNVPILIQWGTQPIEEGYIRDAFAQSTGGMAPAQDLSPALQSYPQFDSAYPPPAPVYPPSTPIYDPPPPVYPPSGWGTSQPAPVYPQPVATGIAWGAWASLVSGILSAVTICALGAGASVVFSVLGIIFFFMAQSQIKAGQQGHGLAVAGLIIAIVCIPFSIILGVLGMLSSAYRVY